MSDRLRVRVLRRTRGDRSLLESFSCADPAVAWEAEVERFVRAELFDWAFEPLAAPADPRVLLLLAGRRLCAVAAHERITMTHRRRHFVATKLVVVAVARAWHGRRFQNGSRASDTILSAAMSDISTRAPPRTARVLAYVHQSNARSLAVCRRHGLDRELSPDGEYRRLVSS